MRTNAVAFIWLAAILTGCTTAEQSVGSPAAQGEAAGSQGDAIAEGALKVCGFLPKVTDLADSFDLTGAGAVNRLVHAICEAYIAKRATTTKSLGEEAAPAIGDEIVISVAGRSIRGTRER
ncbi:hypothetical protein ACVMB2_006010 [Sinorhizobium meliloti]|nr:hypothetical protein CDO29_17445 [Sinorhizobium meliloti]